MQILHLQRLFHFGLKHFISYVHICGDVNKNKQCKNYQAPSQEEFSRSEIQKGSALTQANTKH